MAGTTCPVPKSRSQSKNKPKDGSTIPASGLTSRSKNWPGWSRMTKTSSAPKPRTARTSPVQCSNRSSSSVVPMAKTEEPITIKKYANRRLYNTGTSTYVTLEDLAAMVKSGEDFIVHDAKTGEDITRSVLTQII